MPKGIYNHKPHTEERKKKISKSMKGREFSEDAKKKMSISKRNERNFRWKGDKAKKITLHIWIAKNKPKPNCCEYCKKEKKLNLASMTKHNYTRNIEDYKWLCYSCHKIMDMGWMHNSEFSLFIKNLKWEINMKIDKLEKPRLFDIIDKLAGEELIK